MDRSPFPGMDPYLEHPAIWPGVHNALATYMRDELNRTLGKRYIAELGERVLLETPLDRPRGIYPDVAVISRDTPGTAMASEQDAPVIVEVAAAEFREAFVGIRAIDGSRLITAIEILSPSNKSSRGAGRELYLRKQQETLDSAVHLVEIDLLRSGTWTVAVPEGLARAAAEFDYLICVNRSTRRSRFELYPIPLHRRLPRFALPLLEGDPDVVVDLQVLLDRCYESGRYAERIDHRREATPPLTADQRKWADSGPLREMI